MLFERDLVRIRDQWWWGKHVRQIDCLCTDLEQDCIDWFCEGLYPKPHKLSNFAIHAAGCESKAGMGRHKSV